MSYSIPDFIVIINIKLHTVPGKWFNGLNNYNLIRVLVGLKAILVKSCSCKQEFIFLKIVLTLIL